MPDQDSRRDGGLLPIRVVLPRQGKERRVSGGGSTTPPFRTVDLEFRQHLQGQVATIRQSITPEMQRAGGIPVRVNLNPHALAKSHRPDTLLSTTTCPIIGAGSLGKLFVKGTLDGLDRLSTLIADGESKGIVKELSTIDNFEPITPSIRCGGRTPDEISRACLPREHEFSVRVRLFDFDEKGEGGKLHADFVETCRNYEIAIFKGGYSRTGLTYRATCQSVDDIDVLASIVGVRSISPMPAMRVVHPRFASPGQFPNDLPSPDQFADLPTVVVVDSGVSDQASSLKSWVVGRKTHVDPPYRNDDHGTFVAGLIAWGDILNPSVSAINSGPCTVFDLQVMPGFNPADASYPWLSESELLEVLDRALQSYANRFKVWNISLGIDDVCSLEEFSHLAFELDELQERYQVSFVISSGNYEQAPLLGYPRQVSDLCRGRITSPADSVLGISVGSISHVDYQLGEPLAHEPSTFSRHGPGPGHIIKPDVVHYGGSCSLDMGQYSGLRSASSSGIVEGFGTSYSAPLVARTLAHIYSRITPTPSPVLARALLVHHARDPRTGGRIRDGDEQCFGFGLPAALSNCLGCTEHSITLIFQDTLRPGFFLEWTDFPFPPSLIRDGRYFGEIWMTLAYAPSRDYNWGAEYCRTRVDAHFGVYVDEQSPESRQSKRRFKGLVTLEHSNRRSSYKSQRVSDLRLWTPVKTYYGSLGTNGHPGEQWRLKVRSYTRHGVAERQTGRPQPFSLLITISDPMGKAPIYNEMSQILRNRFFVHDLSVRPSVREKIRIITTS